MTRINSKHASFIDSHGSLEEVNKSKPPQDKGIAKEILSPTKTSPILPDISKKRRILTSEVDKLDSKIRTVSDLNNVLLSEQEKTTSTNSAKSKDVESDRLASELTTYAIERVENNRSKILRFIRNVLDFILLGHGPKLKSPGCYSSIKTAKNGDGNGPIQPGHIRLVNTTENQLIILVCDRHGDSSTLSIEVKQLPGEDVLYRIKQNGQKSRPQSFNKYDIYNNEEKFKETLKSLLNEVECLDYSQAYVSVVQKETQKTTVIESELEITGDPDLDKIIERASKFDDSYYFSIQPLIKQYLILLSSLRSEVNVHKRNVLERMIHQTKKDIENSYNRNQSSIKEKEGAFHKIQEFISTELARNYKKSFNELSVMLEKESQGYFKTWLVRFMLDPTEVCSNTNIKNYFKFSKDEKLSLLDRSITNSIQEELVNLDKAMDKMLEFLKSDLAITYEKTIQDLRLMIKDEKNRYYQQYLLSFLLEGGKGLSM